MSQTADSWRSQQRQFAAVTCLVRFFKLSMRLGLHAAINLPPVDVNLPAWPVILANLCENSNVVILPVDLVSKITKRSL
jgi:hypothetical protein